MSADTLILTLTPQQIAAALAAAREQITALGPLKAIAVTKAEIAGRATVALPLLGDCEIDLSITVTEG